MRWFATTVPALARPAWKGEGDTKTCKLHGLRVPCPLWRGFPGGVGGSRSLVNNRVCEYPARSGGDSLG
eukprot:9014654-Pyramimonas_sp.AAC.1